MTSSLSLAAIAVALGCSDTVSIPDASRDDGAIALPDSGAPDAGTPDAGAASPDAGSTDCDVPLRVLTGESGPERLYAIAERDGAPIALLVDTGSQITFLTTPPGSPDYTPHVADLAIGCETVPTAGRPYASDEITSDGIRVAGFLGNGFFFAEPTLVDLAAEEPFLRPLGEFTPPEGWSRLAYENVHDYIFALARVDGVELRLGVDTGAAHTLWLGQEGRPGDVPVSSRDAYGNPLVLYLGPSSIEFAGEPATSRPVLRIVSFPSLEDSNRLVGGRIDGLLGLTTLGARRYVIDAASSSIWLEPIDS